MSAITSTLIRDNSIIPINTHINERGNKLIIAIVGSDADVLSVYKHIFLRNVILNQEARFECTYFPEPELAYLEKFLFENGREPLALESFCVLCLSSSKSTPTPSIAEEEKLYNSKERFRGLQSEAPHSTLKKKDVSIKKGMYEIEAKWDGNFTLMDRIGLDLRVGRQTREPAWPLALQPLFKQAQVVRDVMNNLAQAKIQELTNNPALFHL